MDEGEALSEGDGKSNGKMEAPGDLLRKDHPSFRPLLLKAAALTKRDNPELENDALTNATWLEFDKAMFKIIATYFESAQKMERRRQLERIAHLAHALRNAMVGHKQDCPAGAEPAAGPCLCGAGAHNAKIMAAMHI